MLYFAVLFVEIIVLSMFVVCMVISMNEKGGNILKRKPYLNIIVEVPIGVLLGHWFW